MISYYLQESRKSRDKVLTRLNSECDQAKNKLQWFLIGRYDYQTAISMMDKSLPDTEMTNILTELIVTGNQQFTAYEQLANEFNTVLAIHKRDNKRAEALLKQVSKELKQIKQPTIKGFKYEEV